MSITTSDLNRIDEVIETGGGYVRADLINIVDGHNHRAIDQEADEFKQLVESVKAMGVLVPLIVSVTAVDGDYVRFELAAGERRLLAARAAGMAFVPVVVRDKGSAQADAAVENMARSELWPLEEANAIKAMIDTGYTEAGAAQILAVSKRKVTDRMQLFRLPEKARSYFGPQGGVDGPMPLGMLKLLVPIADKSPELCDAVAEYAYTSRNFHGNPGWLISRGLEAKKLKVFVETMGSLDEHDLREHGPKKLRELYAEVAKLRGRSGYSAPSRFGEQEVDQARAAGVLLEFENAAPICLDKKLYGVLRTQALGRELAAEVRKLKDAKMASSAKAKRTAKDPVTGEPVELTAVELREQAYKEAAKTWPASALAVNAELGAALLNGLASVDVDMRVAKFFVYGMLGLEGCFDDSGKIKPGFTSTHATLLAKSGMRLCHPELVKVEQTVTKGGLPGKRAKVTYATDKDCEAWLWRFLDGAKTPGELFGRALVLYAASDHAAQEALPRSQQGFTGVPRTRKATAKKTLDALVKAHLPASVKKLRAAIARAEKARSEPVNPPPAPVRPDVPESEWVGDDDA